MPGNALVGAARHREGRAPEQSAGSHVHLSRSACGHREDGAPTTSFYLVPRLGITLTHTFLICCDSFFMSPSISATAYLTRADHAADSVKTVRIGSLSTTPETRAKRPSGRRFAAICAMRSCAADCSEMRVEGEPRKALQQRFTEFPLREMPTCVRPVRQPALVSLDLIGHISRQLISANPPKAGDAKPPV